MFLESCYDFCFDDVIIELSTQLALHFTDPVLVQFCKHFALIFSPLLLFELAKLSMPFNSVLVPVNHHPDAKRQYQPPVIKF